jgi:hypothetical protein
MPLKFKPSDESLKIETKPGKQNPGQGIISPKKGDKKMDNKYSLENYSLDFLKNYTCKLTGRLCQYKTNCTNCIEYLCKKNI